MDSPISPLFLSLRRLPGIQLTTRALFRLALRKNKKRLPKELFIQSELFFVHDLIQNVDTTGNGRADSFLLALTNGWFDQAVTGVEMTVNGRAIDPAKIIVDNDFSVVRANKIRRLRFLAGHPFTLTLDQKTLRSGLHFIGLTLKCDLADIVLPLIPLVIKKGQGKIPLLDEPWDRSLEPLFENEPDRSTHFIPHIHYDFEWLQTAEPFARVAAGNLSEAVRMLEQNPDATFAIDQVPPLEALAKAFPEDFLKLQEFVKQGRVEPMLGGYVEPDTNLPCGESLVRQFVAWQDYAKRVFGKHSTTAWLIDSFGMSGQMPQILRKCGAKSLVFSRRRPADADVASDFIWRGIDESPIRAHYLSRSYFAGYPVDTDMQRAVYRMHRLYKKLRDDSDQDVLFCPSGVDHGRPQPMAAQMLDTWNARFKDAPIRFSTPTQYQNEIDEDRLETWHGELNGELTGVNAARMELKKLSRKAEVGLLGAEALGASVRVLGKDPSVRVLDEAWKYVLKSQFHDSVTGCNTDEVAADVRNRFDRAIDLSGRVSRRLLLGLSQRVIKTTGGRPAIFLYNPTGFARHEMIETDLHAKHGKLPLISDGRRFVPYQVLSMERFSDDTDQRARVLFAAEVPPMGYRAYYLTWDESFQKPHEFNGVKVLCDRMENGKIWVRLNPKTGAIKFVTDKQTGRLWQLQTGGMLTLRRDRGTLYQELPAGFFKKQKMTRMRVAESGPLRATIEVTGTVGKSQFTTCYSLSAGSTQVDIQTNIDFNDPGYSLFADASFDPFAFSQMAQIPFGAIRRDQGSHIAQNYVHLDFAPDKSLSILNRGIPGYHHLKKGVKLALTRSVNKIHFSDSGNGALCLGRQKFEYALRFTEGDFETAAPWRYGAVYNSPLQVLPLPGKGGAQDPIAPARHSFVHSDAPNIEITNFAPLPDGTVRLRLVESMGQTTQANINFGFDVQEIALTDMLGRKAAAAPTSKRRAELEFRPFEIKTLQITLAKNRAPQNDSH